MAIWVAADRDSWLVRLPGAGVGADEIDFLGVFLVSLFWPITLTRWITRASQAKVDSDGATVGKDGDVSRDLIPVGRVVIDGVEFEARAATGTITLKSRVRVLEVQLGQLIVQRIE